MAGGDGAKPFPACCNSDGRGSSKDSSAAGTTAESSKSVLNVRIRASPSTTAAVRNCSLSGLECPVEASNYLAVMSWWPAAKFKVIEPLRPAVGYSPGA